MSIEIEAADGSRATQTLFEASEIKVVKLVLGTTTVLLTTLVHDEGFKTGNSGCLSGSLEQQGNAYPLHAVDIVAVDSPSDVSQEEPQAVEEMTKEEFVEKLRGWMMVLASLFASMTFQAGLNPPGRFRSNVQITEHDVLSSSQLRIQARFFVLLNSFVFAYSLGLVMLMLFRSSLAVEKLIGKREPMCRRGLLCCNILLLLLVFGLGSADSIYSMLTPLFGCSFFVYIACYNIIRDNCKEWWKKLRGKF